MAEDHLGVQTATALSSLAVYVTHPTLLDGAKENEMDLPVLGLTEMLAEHLVED